MRTLIVIPTYNEVENIQPLTEAIFANVGTDVHVLIVDDHSPDGTGQLADALAASQPRLHVLHRAGKMGLGAAYRAGFQWGMEGVNGEPFDLFIEMDADFSHHPQYLPRMIELLRTHDFVMGSRYVSGGGTKNWGLSRKWISRGGSFYARTILGVNIRDFTGGFNGWHRKVLESISMETLQSDGYSFQIELKHRAALRGFSFCEFPIIFEDRKVGQSKMSRRIVVEALTRVWEFRLRYSKFKTQSPLTSKLAK